ncbi:unnamed protein product [Mytilus coruscus]|uniref:Glycoside hydrolase family 5 domain-containing protein n=1 Tax=Mytilus coruscus TaxID=42192 RepID=A0A6J8DZU9_MYTCO|nr:unnamed protein product [Mytilus coruscus]
MVLLMLVVLCFCSLKEVAASGSPISPQSYKNVLNQGFTTTYFEQLNFDQVYDKKDVEDVSERGFTNLRLRCREDLDGFNMTAFLANLETVVDDCLSLNVTPYISWINHAAEADATEKNRQGYLDWWKAVAIQLKDKDYRLSFNLFTELDTDSSLRTNTSGYNDWTRSVIKVIRDTGGNNEKRILILASPEISAEGLQKIDPTIYQNDTYLMIEAHTYAAGPQNIFENGSCKSSPPRCWIGDGETMGKSLVDQNIEFATKFTRDNGIEIVWGAWMPFDNTSGGLNETEVIDFSTYFVQSLKNASIPWSVNDLNTFYDVMANQWKTELSTIKEQQFNTTLVLDAIVENM